MLLCSIVGTACAQNVSFSDLGLAGPQMIQIYTANGSLQGTYNTTISGISLPNEDFFMVIKPEPSNPLASPSTFLTDTAFPFVQTNIIGITVLIILAAIWARSIR